VTIDPQAINAEIEAMRAQAVREGLAEGRSLAAQELRAAMEGEAQRWREGIAALETALQQKLGTLEALAVEIGYEAVAVVLGEGYAKEAGIVGSVRRLIDAAAGGMHLSVRVAPSQLERVRAALGVHMSDPQRRLQFEADITLADNECRVVSENGSLETSLKLQLQAIQDTLLRAHARGTATHEAVTQ
jgi:flagellar biosynthesis/type III secretory pathway protein FliH